MVIESRNEKLFLKKSLEQNKKWIPTKASHLNVYFYKYSSEVKKEKFFFQNLQKTVLLKTEKNFKRKPKTKI